MIIDYALLRAPNADAFLKEPSITTLSILATREGGSQTLSSTVHRIVLYCRLDNSLRNEIMMTQTTH